MNPREYRFCFLKISPRRIFEEAGDFRRGCVFLDPPPYALVEVIMVFFYFLHTFL